MPSNECTITFQASPRAKCYLHQTKTKTMINLPFRPVTPRRVHQTILGPGFVCLFRLERGNFGGASQFTKSQTKKKERWKLKPTTEWYLWPHLLETNGIKIREEKVRKENALFWAFFSHSKSIILILATARPGEVSSFFLFCWISLKLMRERGLSERDCQCIWMALMSELSGAVVCLWENYWKD